MKIKPKESQKWKKSKYRMLYLYIAIKHFVTPTHVYKVAHTDDPYFMMKNKRIYRDLINCKVLHTLK